MTDKKLSQKNWSSWHHQLHKEILAKKILIPKGSNILISVSGGQDSMALLTLINDIKKLHNWSISCLLYTSPSPRDSALSRMPSSA